MKGKRAIQRFLTGQVFFIFILLSILFCGLWSLMPPKVAAEEAPPQFDWKIPQMQWYFSSPNGVAVDGSGNVYVADTGNHRIQKFSSSGVFVDTWGSKGRENGQFKYPAGVAVDGSGNVHVADSGNHRIQKFSYPTSIEIELDRIELDRFNAAQPAE